MPMGVNPEFAGVEACTLGVLWLDHAFITAAEVGWPEGKTAAVGITGRPEAAEGGPEATEGRPEATEGGPEAAEGRPRATGREPDTAEARTEPAWLPGDGSMIFCKLGGGALGAPVFGASNVPLKGGIAALFTGVTVVVTTRGPSAGWEAPLLDGRLAAEPAAKPPTWAEGSALRVALLGGNPATLGACNPWAMLAAII